MFKQGEKFTFNGKSFEVTREKKMCNTSKRLGHIQHFWAKNTRGKKQHSFVFNADKTLTMVY